MRGCVFWVTHLASLAPRLPATPASALDRFSSPQLTAREQFGGLRQQGLVQASILGGAPVLLICPDAIDIRSVCRIVDCATRGQQHIVF